MGYVTELLRNFDPKSKEKPVNKIDLRFTRPQEWAHNAFHSRGDKPVTVCMPWGRGSGKSWFIRTEGIHLAVAENYGKLRENALKPFRGVRIIGLCPTLKQFRDIHEAQLISELEGDWKPFGGKLNKSTLRIEWPDGSWFQPMPAQTASSKAARGQRCDIVLPDEADDIPLGVFQSVVKPWFSEPWSLHRVLAGGTPTQGRNGLLWHLHALGVSDDPRHARYLSKIATWRDSPEVVSADEVEDARLTTDPAVFEREWECNFDSGGGLVYPTFDESIHVKEPPQGIRFHRYALGIDHGWEHPGVFLLVGVAGYGEDSVVWVLEEICEQKKENCEWDAIARERFYGLKAYADKSRPDRLADLRKAGLNVVGADNSHEAGIGRVANLLFVRRTDTDERGIGDEKASARLYIHPQCKKLIAEMKSYRRKPDAARPGQFLDDVVKVGDDCVDALRYVVLGELGRIGSGKTLVSDA